MNQFFLANRTGTPLHVRHIPDPGPPRRAILVCTWKEFADRSGHLLTIACDKKAHRVPELDAVARKECRLVIRNLVSGSTVLRARDGDDDLVVIVTMKN